MFLEFVPIQDFEISPEIFLGFLGFCIFTLGIVIPKIRDFFNLGISTPRFRNFYLGILIPGIQDFAIIRDFVIFWDFIDEILGKSFGHLREFFIKFVKTSVCILAK